MEENIAEADNDGVVEEIPPEVELKPEEDKKPETAVVTDINQETKPIAEVEKIVQQEEVKPVETASLQQQQVAEEHVV